MSLGLVLFIHKMGVITLNNHEHNNSKNHQFLPGGVLIASICIV